MEETPSAAFPSSAYGKYKRATAYFLHWLLRARQLGGYGALENANNQQGKKSKKGPAKPTTNKTQPLDEYERIIAAIAQRPALLPDIVRRQWPRAMAACECAITLRAQVAQYFPPKDGDDPHIHFLQRLVAWFQTLRDANAIVVGHGHDDRSTTPTLGRTLDFANYFDVLDLPNDFFDDEADADADPVPTTTPTFASSRSSARKKVARDRTQLVDESLVDDVALEVAYLVMELDELSEGVYRAFQEVKRQQKTLVEATVVAHAAVDFAQHVVAQFQLQHPTVGDANDLEDMIATYASMEHAHAIARQLHATWVELPREKDSDERTSSSDPYQYVRGTALLDLMWVTTCLQHFLTLMPDGPHDVITIPDGGLDAPFDEARTPQYTIPALFPAPTFFAQQLVLLFNATVDYGLEGVALEALGFTDFFFQPLVAFFKTRVVSIELVVVCIYWVRSVSALQGDRGLGRTVGLALLQRWDLEARLRAAVAQVRTSPHANDDAPLVRDQQNILSNMRVENELTALTRANPLVAGGLLLTTNLNYIHIGTEVSLATTRLRAFCHVYSALRDRELLDAIPLVEDVLTLYERFFFTPSRAAAVHGSFLRVYEASCVNAVSPSDRRRKQNKHHARDRTCRCLYSSSRIVQLLTDHEYTELLSSTDGVASTSASWTARLACISDVCSDELFRSRVLSRDMLQLSNDLTELFVALRDGLEANDEFAALLSEMDPHTPRDRAVDEALEDVVMVPLLPLLDALALDGSATFTVVVGDAPRARTTVMATELNELVLQYCQHAAAIVAAHFDPRDPSRMERTYYTFPPTCEWATMEFGDVRRHDLDERAATPTATDSFHALMKMMEESTGPLTVEQVATLKTQVQADPALLSMVLSGAETELCTLLHHAAAGRARDRSLVEWLIQMGALDRQPKHFYRPSRNGPITADVRNPNLCNYMAVHSAAKAGLTDMVRLILEAENLRDINKVTYHTNESLAHLAVRNGDRTLFTLLDRLNADVCHKDADGKYVHDLTTSPSWKRDILKVVVWQRQTHAHRDAKAKLGATPQPARANDGGISDAVNEMQGLALRTNMAARITETPIESPDRIDRLTRWLDVLKQGSAASSADRDVAAAAALDVVDTVRANIQYFVQSPTLHQISRRVILRDVIDASRVLFLLTKFYRQLPASRRDVRPPADSSALEKLWQRAGPAAAFDDFLSLAMHTAFLLLRANRLAQAQELLELVERRLLKFPKPWDATFRTVVVAYLTQRRSLGIEPLDGSSVDAQRVFTWLAPSADHGPSKMDMLRPYQWFRCLVPRDDVPRDALQQLYEHVATAASTPELSMLCLHAGHIVVVAAYAQHALNRAVGVIGEAAARSGVRFHAHSDADNTNVLVVHGLEFVRFV